MNKEKLIERTAMGTGVSKADTERVINKAMEEIKVAVAAGERVMLIGFGTFDVQERAERSAIHPTTGKKIKIKACKAPRFRPGTTFKQAVNKKKRGRPKKNA